jgi:DNA-binding PadR family transcriptional regulator
MSVKHALLGILAQSPRHGYDLKRVFDDKLGDFWTLNFGQIYTTLDRLHAEGFVEYDTDGQDEKGDKPDRKVYRITDAGRTEFNEWRTSALKAEPRVLRDELFLRVLFMDDDEIESVLGLIRNHQSVYLSQMMHLTNRKFEIDQSTKKALQKNTESVDRKKIEREYVIKNMLIDAAIFHAEADIRWLRHCESRLTELMA